MDFRDYNDYEIIAMIQEGSEEALQLMATKYKLLIAKKVSKFNLNDEYDDCLQEGLIVLHKSAMKFRESFGKTFTRYFEMNLENRFISIVRRRSRYFKFLGERLPKMFEYKLYESPATYFPEQEYALFLSDLSSFERVVYEARFLREEEISEIAKTQSCPIKKVYNAIDRIRAKLKNRLSS